MKNKNPFSTLDRLNEEAVRDLMEASETDLRLEASEAGEDFNAYAAQVRGVMVSAVAAMNRQRLERAQKRLADKAPIPLRTGSRKSVEEMRSEIREAASRNPLVVNFRKAEKLTDSDLASMYEDLLTLGLIERTDHEG